MANKKTVIGITGHPASGKDAVSEYLATTGFFTVSSGDILREEMKKIGLTLDRASVHEFAKKMRNEYGNSYPAEKVLEIINKKDGNVVISGMRNTEEVMVIKDGIGSEFKLIAVNSPIEVRYERAKKRGRIGDDISFEQFKDEEEKEKNNSSGSHEVDRVIAIADIIIENDGTLDELYLKVDEIIK